MIVRNLCKTHRTIRAKLMDAPFGLRDALFELTDGQIHL